MFSWRFGRLGDGVKSSLRSFRLTTNWKMAAIGTIGCLGLIVLGGLGYWASQTMDNTARDVLEQERLARSVEVLRRDMVALNMSITELFAFPERGAAHLDQLRRNVAELVGRAKTLRPRVRAEEQQTLVKQTLGNLEDLGMFMEYDLPEVFELDRSVPDGLARLRELNKSRNLFYDFAGRTMSKLVDLIVADAEQARVALEATGRKVRLALVAAFVLTACILGPIFFLFRNSIVRPLASVVAMARDLRNGRVAARVEVGRRRDEFRDMADALNGFADSLEHEVVDYLQKLAAGDLSGTITPAGTDDRLRQALIKVGQDLDELLRTLQTTGLNLGENTEKTREISQSLSRQAAEQAASLEEIGASLGQVADQVQTNAGSAERANRLSDRVQEKVEAGNAKMENLVAAMEKISASGQDVSRIIKVIDEIAFQTNLLALNAAVEAARAGQHGKGFAVVAEEVRNLAARSARAAKETAELIENSVALTTRGRELAGDTASGLAEVVAGVTEVSDILEEIARASGEQSTAIAQINDGLAQIDHLTQRGVCEAEASSEAVQKLSDMAADLKNLLQRFRLRRAA